MAAKALDSLAAAETELRELRSAGAVLACSTSMTSSSHRASRALGHPFAALRRHGGAGLRHRQRGTPKLDADIAPDELEDADPFEEGDLGVLADLGLPDAVLGVILSETDLYADEQIGRIAREMGFAEELSAVLDRLGR